MTAERSPRGGRPAWFLCAVAVLLGGLLYANVLHNPFVYDDLVTIVENPSLQEPINIRAVVLYDVFRPMVNLSYAIDFVLWGRDVVGFHRTSIFLHMVSVALLFLLAWRATEDLGGERDPRAVASVAALLYACHPMMSEAVGYVSGRSEVLSTVFVLTTVLSLRRFLVRGSTRWLAAGLVSFVLALASKEVAAMLPFLVLAYDRLLLPGDGAARRRRFLRFHLPFLAFVTIAGLARVAVYLRVESGGVENLWTNLLVEAGVVWRYLALLILPVGQSLVHDVRPLASALDPLALLALLGLAGVMAGLWLLRRQQPLLVFGLAWFFLMLAPSHLIPLNEAMAEHRVYSASAGLFLAVGGLAGWLSKRLAARGFSEKVQVVVLLAPLVAVLSTATVVRNRVWSDPVRLWTDAATKAPRTWAARYSLGDALQNAGRCPEAIEHYRTATEILPERLQAYWNLGICLAETGRPLEAQLVFETALAIDPANPKTLNNLGALAMIQGRTWEARSFFERSLQHDPGNARARSMLSRLE